MNLCFHVRLSSKLFDSFNLFQSQFCLRSCAKICVQEMWLSLTVASFGIYHAVRTHYIVPEGSKLEACFTYVV